MHEAHQAGQAGAGEGQFRCALSGASFPTLGELKEHYRTDWYPYNVKLKLKGQKGPVSAHEFRRGMKDLSGPLFGPDIDCASCSSTRSTSPPQQHLSRLLSGHTLSTTAPAKHHSFLPDPTARSPSSIAACSETDRSRLRRQI
ncbi:hypothetical protein JCM10213_008585 [Rhodosporidiobolus nylandii]